MAGSRPSGSPTWTTTTSTRRSASRTRFPRFCGQTFAERDDKELALECVKAYNDWMIDEWCAGDGHGRLIPVTMVPLWDAQLAAAEVRRCADKGSHALTFSENPYALGLPSVHSGEWDPLFAACQETETVVCMHIGSSSRMPGTTPDAPFIVSSVLTFPNAMGSLLDFVFSGTLERFPNLTHRVLRGPGRVDAVRARADGQAVARALRQRVRQQPPRAAHHLHQGPRDRLHLRRRERARQRATASAWTRSASRPTTRTPTARSRTRRRWRGRSARRPGSTTTRPTSCCAATPSSAFGLERFGITK